MALGVFQQWEKDMSTYWWVFSFLVLLNEGNHVRLSPSWVIKTFHCAIPYSNEEEISLLLNYFLQGLYFYSLLRLWKMFLLLELVSYNVLLNCESGGKK